MFYGDKIAPKVDFDRIWYSCDPDLL